MKKLCSGFLCLLFCLSLCACQTGPGQEKAGSEEEALNNFLSDLQTGDFAMAQTYLYPENRLGWVLKAAAGEESVPELDEVYRAAAEGWKSLTCSVSVDSETSQYVDFYSVTGQTKDYDAALRSGMAAALQQQAAEGGDAFSNLAGWMKNAIENAEMGETDEAKPSVVKNSSGYSIDHRGYPDVHFLNLITGGFYEYIDMSMTTCTMKQGGVEYTYYLAAMGDEVVGYLQETAEAYDPEQVSPDDIMAYQQYCFEASQGIEGVYTGAHTTGDHRLVTTTAIDFNEASQTAMINAGIVSGRYSGNTTSNYLSLSATIKGFESDGMTCVTVPTFE